MSKNQLRLEETVSEVKIDWLTVTVYTPPTEPDKKEKELTYFAVETLAESILKIIVGIKSGQKWRHYFESLGHGALSFKEIEVGPWGVKIYHVPKYGQYCSVEMRGDFIDCVGQAEIGEWLRFLDSKKLKWRVTRLDVAFDGVSFKPRDCLEAWLIGDRRSAVADDGYKWMETGTGSTFYLGARTSPRYLRVYAFKGKPTRLEIEFKKPLADLITRKWLEVDFFDWSRLVLGHVRQLVDFVDRKEGVKSSEWALKVWWDRLVSGSVKACGIAHLAQSRRDWVMGLQNRLSALLPSLCVYRQGFGVSIDVLCDGVEERLKQAQRVKIDLIRTALLDVGHEQG